MGQLCSSPPRPDSEHDKGKISDQLLSSDSRGQGRKMVEKSCEKLAAAARILDDLSRDSRMDLEFRDKVSEALGYIQKSEQDLRQLRISSLEQLRKLSSSKRLIQCGEDKEVASWLQTGFLNRMPLNFEHHLGQDSSTAAEQISRRRQASRIRWNIALNAVITYNQAKKLSRRISGDRAFKKLEPSDLEGSDENETSLSTLEVNGECTKLKKTVSELENRCLSKILSWNDFDVFELNELSEGRPLVSLSYYILQKNGIFDELGIKTSTFVNFFSSIENGYLDMPYHNKVHAADVVANTYYFVMSSNLKGIFTRIDFLASITAAAIHDFKHPGTNNGFLVVTQHELSLLYNDKSVLENYHLAEAFRLLRLQSHNFLSNLPSEDAKQLRQTVISMVLATDMSQHLNYLTEMEEAVHEKKQNGKWFDSTIYEDRLVCLNMLLHASDLGNPAKPLKFYLEWTDRVMKEFFSQGDKEKELGLAISPMMNREKPNLEKSQIGFIDYVISPLYRLWASVVGKEAGVCLENIDKNRAYWAKSFESK